MSPKTHSSRSRRHRTALRGGTCYRVRHQVCQSSRRRVGASSSDAVNDRLSCSRGAGCPAGGCCRRLESARRANSSDASLQRLRALHSSLQCCYGAAAHRHRRRTLTYERERSLEMLGMRQGCWSLHPSLEGVPGLACRMLVVWESKAVGRKSTESGFRVQFHRSVRVPSEGRVCSPWPVNVSARRQKAGGMAKRIPKSCLLPLYLNAIDGARRSR